MITVALVIDKFTDVGMLPTGIVSSVENDSISVYFISENKYADIELFDSGEVLAVMSDRKNHPPIWEVYDDTLQQAVLRIQDFIENKLFV